MSPLPAGSPFLGHVYVVYCVGSSGCGKHKYKYNCVLVGVGVGGVGGCQLSSMCVVAQASCNAASGVLTILTSK